MGLGLQPRLARALFPLTRLSPSRPARVRRITVLAYHRIGTPAQLWPDHLALAEADLRQFTEQMQWLREHCSPITVEQARQIIFGELQCPARATLVTIDDGYAADIHRIAPVLRQTGIRPIVFLATSYVGNCKRFWWDRIAVCVQATAKWRLRSDRYPQLDCALDSPTARQQAADGAIDGLAAQLDPDAREQLIAHLEHVLDLPSTAVGQRPTVLDWDEVRQLGELLDFGAHTESHARLNLLEPSTVRHEVEGSKTTLERQLGLPCTTLAIPYGHDASYTDASIAICAEAGFQLVFSLEPALRPPQIRDGCALVNRIAVGPRDGVEGLAIKIAWPRLFVPDYLTHLARIYSQISSRGGAADAADA